MKLPMRPPPLPAIDWRKVNLEAEKIIRQHSRTFFLATSLLPARTRAAIRSLYAFCRKTDDLIDLGGASLEELEAWRDQVDHAEAARDDPVLMLWARVRDEFSVNRRYEQELIDGVRLDLMQATYRTWEDLRVYCYHVASTVGLLSIPIIGLAPGVSLPQAEHYAMLLGVALQLTNILRDVGEDLSAGRVYLPLEDLERFGMSLQDLRSGVVDVRFKELMRFEIARARRLYELALPGIALLSRAARPAVGAASLLYQAILDEIEKMDYQVFHCRAFTTGKHKLAMLPHILLTVARIQPPLPGEPLPGL